MESLTLETSWRERVQGSRTWHADRRGGRQPLQYIVSNVVETAKHLNSHYHDYDTILLKFIDNFKPIKRISVLSSSLATARNRKGLIQTEFAEPEKKNLQGLKIKLKFIKN